MAWQTTYLMIAKSLENLSQLKTMLVYLLDSKHLSPARNICVIPKVSIIKKMFNYEIAILVLAMKILSDTPIFVFIALIPNINESFIKASIFLLEP